MTDNSPVHALTESLRGRLIRPDDSDYDEARRVYNAMIDRRPAFVVRCVDVADVIAAVHFAREQALPLAVRGGGHSGPGLGVCDDGVVVDLGAMRGVRVDLAARTVRAAGGCTWGEVDHATHAFGLAVPSGIVSTTGVGGLTLGGGIGYLARRYGLTIDNLVGADVVLADGGFVTASAEQNADLFWALRGGGGNFGVVTSFEFRLHPVTKVFGGPMLWPIERAADVLRFWRDFVLAAPEDINGWFGFLTVPGEAPFPASSFGRKMCGITWCYTGPLEEVRERLAPARVLGPPAVNLTGVMPFPMLQSMHDPFFPPGLQWYWKTDFFTGLGEEAIAVHGEHIARSPTAMSTMHLYPINGAVQRVGRNETAFGSRGADFAGVIIGIDPDPAQREPIVGWARDYWHALHRFSAGGAYVNMMMDEGQDEVRAAYGDSYEHLRAVKERYDPDNLFRVNHNILPAAGE